MYASVLRHLLPQAELQELARRWVQSTSGAVPEEPTQWCAASYFLAPWTPPDLRRRDLDNLLKPTLDALQHAGVYEDDSQVDLLMTRRGGVVPGGRLAVRMTELPLRQCPLCGSPIDPTAQETN